MLLRFVAIMLHNKSVWTFTINLVSKPSLLQWRQERKEVEVLRVKVAEGGLGSRSFDSSATGLGTSSKEVQ